MSTRLSIVAAAMLVVVGAPDARAQITTVVGPAKRVQTNPQDSVRREQAAQDSVARVTMTDMKQWVDSAANALSLRPDSATATAEPSTATVPATPQAPMTPQRDSATVRRGMEVAPPEFREGGRAPDTATSVPTLAVLGAGLVILGLVVGRRRRSSADSSASH